MGPFTTLDFPEGKIAFIGTIRVNDEGVNEFCADLPGRPSLYGEWQPIFEPNGNDLNVKIASFGYSDRSNVGNPHPGAKIRLSEEEKHSIEILLHKLFECSEIRNGVFPFSSRKARFLGRLFFDDQWALD